MQLATDNAIGAAGFLLNVRRPYLASALWSVQRVAVPGLGTLAVDDRWRLFYDPEVAAAWSVEELGGVLYHEIAHLLRAHAERRAALAASPAAWNLAADAEINDDLCDEEVDLPGDPITPAALGQPTGRLAEEYYAALLRSDNECPFREPEVGAGRCGSGAGGLALADAACTTSRPGLQHDEVQVVRRMVAHAVREQERQRGSVPAHWRLWAEAVLEPRVDWRRQLSAVVRRALSDVAGAVDYTYRRPSRRQASFGAVVAPALRQPVPDVVVIVDTSGSMADLLGQALAEVGGVLNAAGIREGVRVLSVDAAVHASKRVWQAKQVALVGGGGTDLRVGLAAAEGLHPDVVVVLTDGFTPWPARPPEKSRVVIVDLAGGGAQFPAWAEVIHVN